EQMGNLDGVARASNNLGLVFQALGDSDSAEVWYRRSLQLAERLGSRQLAAQQLANLGDIALAQGRAQEAQKLWREAVSVFTLMKVAGLRDMYERRLRELDAHQTSLGQGRDEPVKRSTGGG